MGSHLGEVWPSCGCAPAHVCWAYASLLPSKPSPCTGWAPAPSSEGGRGGGGVVQPCWSNVYLDSWYFSWCLHFKAIHHAQGITSRPWIAELAPWEVFSCENWLGRTALPYEKKNALTLLFLKGKVNGRGWIDSHAFSADIWLSYALLSDGYGQVWPRWRDLVQMGMGRLLHLQTVMTLELASSVVLNFSLPVMCVCLHSRMDQWKEMQALRSELQTSGLRFWLWWDTTVLLDEKFGLVWYLTQWV